MAAPWFKFSRRYVDSPFCGDPKYDPIYIWFASEASQVEHSIVNGNREIVLRPGQLLTGRHRACERLGLTEMEWRGRLRTLRNNQLIDAKGTNRFTIITLIDPDTYTWQSGVYSRKRTSKGSLKQPPNNQQISTTVDEEDSKSKNSAHAHMRIEGEDMNADEAGPSSSECMDASFSPTKARILEIWKTEREKVGLKYIRSPRNDRAAITGAALVDVNEVSLIDIETAIQTLMSFPDERRRYTLAGLIDNLELWVNGGPEDGATGKLRPLQKKVGRDNRPTRYAHLDRRPGDDETSAVG